MNWLNRKNGLTNGDSAENMERAIGGALSEAMAQVDNDLHAETVDMRKTFAADEMQGLQKRRDALAAAVEAGEKVIADNIDYVNQVKATVAGLDIAIETIAKTLHPTLTGMDELKQLNSPVTVKQNDRE